MAMKRSPTPDPYRNVVPSSDRSVIAWTDASGALRSAIADQRCLAHELETARVSRRPVKYQHRRNYEGFYWCAGSGESVWYESMTEYSALMKLDHTCKLAKVAAQPFCILFDDGSRHYPDFFAVHLSGQQVLYDVRPAQRVDDKAQEQFGKTRDLCDRIGWGYEVLNGVTGVERHNLEWLAGYRHSYAAPGAELASRVREGVSTPVPLGELAYTLDPELPVRFLPMIYHLMWSGALSYTPSIPLGWKTLIGRNSDG